MLTLDLLKIFEVGRRNNCYEMEDLYYRLRDALILLAEQNFDKKEISSEIKKGILIVNKMGEENNDKKEIYDDFKSKVSFYRDSTTGLQLSSLQLQGDFVTTLQRAFMEQNKTKIRRMAHATTETENASILLRANVALKSYFLLH